MLGNFDAMTMIAVKDLDAAKRFYRDTLGFTPNGMDDDQVAGFKTGATRVAVYRSEFAGTNKATTANFVVGDKLDAIVNDLRAKGVTFEHYDLPNNTGSGDVHKFGDLEVAWFKDPDGNILSLQNS